MYWLVSLVPSIPFILIYFAYRHTLKGKRLTILLVMQGNKVFESYVSAFIRPTGSRKNSPPHQLNAEGLVDELFNVYYHWRHYGYGIFLTAVTVTCVTAATLKAQGIPVSLPVPLAGLLVHTPLTMSVAFAGAYIGNLYELMTRYRAVDLTPTAFQFSWIGLLTACIAGPLAAAAATEGLKPVIAFGIGLIPLRSLFEYFANYAQRRLNIATQNTPAEGPTLHHLEGMTSSVITRLEEEKIHSVRALSYSDPVKLFLKTDFEWALIIDFIDQALLYNYIGDKLKALASLGIGGSIDMATIYLRFLEDRGKTQSSSVTAATAIPDNRDTIHTISAIAQRVGIKEEEAKNLLRMIFEDIQVDFIWNIVGGDDDEIKDDEHEAVERAASPSAPPAS